MAILNYIPRTSEVKNYKNVAGGYYEAKCEYCGTLYYPKRSTSRFCSKTCTTMNMRDTKADKKEMPVLIDSKVNLINILADYTINTKANIKAFFSRLEDSKEKVYLSNELYIKKISAYKYEVYDRSKDKLFINFKDNC